MQEHFALDMLGIIFFMGVAALSLLLTARLKFPFTVGLVIIGLVLGILSKQISVFFFLQEFSLTPDLILYLFLPVLIFDASIHIHTYVLKKNLFPVLLLAIVGVAIAAIITGAGISAFLPISFAGALVFGALISATDPVAVIALFEEAGAPRRLKTLVDGESLFNDATAIVLFNVVISLALGKSLNFFDATTSFFTTLIGGVLVGTVVAVMGLAMVLINSSNRIYMLTLSLVIAYVSFIVADHFFHVSGVMATMSAGIILRNRLEKKLRYGDLKSISNFWNYFSFVANSLIFLLLGLTEAAVFSDIKDFGKMVGDIAVAVVIITGARVVVIYALIPLYNRLTSQYKINGKTQFVLLWGGLRGAVPVALVLMIPASLEYRSFLIHLTMGYILFTLLFQGTTMSAVMKKLKIHKDLSHFIDRPFVKIFYSFSSKKAALIVFREFLEDLRTDGFYVHETDIVDGKMKAEVHLHEVIIELSIEMESLRGIMETEHLDMFEKKLNKTVNFLKEEAQDINTLSFVQAKKEELNPQNG
ncbi:MAG: sodium:proton antiporter [Deltaproteobacteria bacterium]|nr:sodium:proton antiporter [Deltaproteobacteria bacterium]